MKLITDSKTYLTAAATTLLPTLALAQNAADPIETTGGAAGAPAGGGYSSIIFIALMILFMWFFLIRPQSKRQKEHKNFLGGLQVGQEVVTQGGVIGKITSMTDTVITLDVGNASIRVLRSAVSGELGKVPSESPALAQN